MPFFKYYRPGIHLDKAIRYNELYFSSNAELNDPNDLKAYYKFEDDVDAWRQLFELSRYSETWDLRYAVNFENEEFLNDINEVFKNTRIEQEFIALKKLFNELKPQIDILFTKHLRDLTDMEECPGFWKGQSTPGMLGQCQLSLRELLAHGVNTKFYSVSFSADPLNPMMWAHYADGFKGCVLIYQDTNKYIDIAQNLYQGGYVPKKIHEVIYIDNDKEVPILTCAHASNNKEKVREELLKKNKFWDYEIEHRAFVEIEYSTIHIAAMSEDDLKIDPWSKIYHHKASALAGVIFGPKFEPSNKIKVEAILRQNRSATDRGIFYLFDTSLTSLGEIEVNKARICNTAFDGFMGEQITGDKLKELTESLGIKRHLKI